MKSTSIAESPCVMKFWFTLSALLFCCSGIVWSSANEKEKTESDDGCYESYTASPSAYLQSPMIDDLVATGELPPIEDRLPTLPLTITAIESTGRYCTELNVIAYHDDGRQVMSSLYRANFPLRVDLTGDVSPDVIGSYSVKPDAKEMTLTLRENMKWSDGTAFTSEDLLLKYEIDKTYPGLGASWHRLPAGIEKMESIGRYEVKITFDTSFPMFPLYLTTWRGGESVLYVPSNWLKNLYGDEAAAKASGYADWFEALALCCKESHLGRPTHQPWYLSEYATGEVRKWQRNPYYHVVDTAGQQLPYFDHVVSTVVDQSAYHLKVLAGEVDITYVAQPAAYRSYLSALSGETDMLSVKQIPGVHGSEAAYTFNFDHPDEDRRELFQDLRFRRALSQAIDREEINRSVFSGLAVPRQATVVSQVSYYQPSWGHENDWIEYDPDAARMTLDNLGLSVHNSDGFRRFEGSADPFTLTIGHGEFLGTGGPISELVTGYWTEIGLNVQLVEYSNGDVADPTQSGKYDGHFISRALVGTEIYDIISESGGVLGIRNLGDTDFAPLKTLHAAIAARRSTSYDTDEYKSRSAEIYNLHADYGFTIGTVGMTPILVVTRREIGNIPDLMPPWSSGALALDFFGAQWFMK